MSALFAYGSGTSLPQSSHSIGNGNYVVGILQHLKVQWSDPIAVTSAFMVAFPGRLPINSKSTFTKGSYKYTVRSHKANPNATIGSNSANGPIFRVERSSTVRSASGRGTGTEFLDIHGNWHHTSKLRQYNRDGSPNPNYNAEAANNTHIPNVNTYYGNR